MKRLLLINLFSFIAYFSFAQSVYGDNGEGSVFFFAGLGVRPLTHEDLDIYFRYVDESPSRDNITEEFKLKANSIVVPIRIGVGYKASNQYFGSISAEFSLARPSTIWQVNAGRSLKYKNFTINPSLCFEYGTGGVKLGDIKNNDVYIQVNNVQFYSNTASVSVKNSFMSLRPTLGLSFPLGDEKHFYLYGDLSYNLILHTGSSYLYFDGKDKDGNGIGESETLSAPNVFLMVNSKRVENTFVKYNGIAFNIGIGFHL